jgi:chromatin segregation and condensation protein Rec8/ScpA/Scc1 (kleisin family)
MALFSATIILLKTDLLLNWGQTVENEAAEEAETDRQCMVYRTLSYNSIFKVAPTNSLLPP